MANTFKIVKRGPKKWLHYHNDIPETEFSISDFECSIDGKKFKIVENDGSTRYPYLIDDITIIDETGAGTPETYTSLIAFEDRLRELEYPPYVQDSMMTALIELLGAGSNIFFTGGNGTIGNKLFINAINDGTGGGGAGFTRYWNNFEFDADADDPGEFTIPAGLLPTIVQVNSGRGLIKVDEWTVSGTILTLTPAALAALELVTGDMIYVVGDIPSASGGKINYDAKFMAVNPNNAPVGTSYSCVGILSAIVRSESDAIAIVVRVTMTAPLSDYKVTPAAESNASLSADGDIFFPVFKRVSDTVFDFTIQQSSSENKNLTIHLNIQEL